jgi:UDP-N-acetylmuramyl tripeptide synthase
MRSNRTGTTKHNLGSDTTVGIRSGKQNFSQLDSPIARSICRNTVTVGAEIHTLEVRSRGLLSRTRVVGEAIRSRGELDLVPCA